MKERAVGETGQAVVERLVAQLLLELDAFCDVSGVEDDAADLPVVSKVGDMGIEVSPFSEAVGQEQGDLMQASVTPRGRHLRAVVGVHELHETRTQQILLGTADHRAH